MMSSKQNLEERARSILELHQNLHDCVSPPLSQVTTDGPSAKSELPSVSPEQSSRAVELDFLTGGSSMPRRPVLSESIEGVTVESSTLSSEGRLKRQPISVKYDYVLFETGYTSRLVEHYLRKGCMFYLRVDSDATVTRNPFSGARREDKRTDITLTPDTLKTGVKGYAYEYKEGECDRVNSADDETDHKPLLICDSLWGDGTYLAHGEDRKTAEKLVAILPGDTRDGIIVYKYKDMDQVWEIARTLGDLDYCAFFDMPHDMYELVGDNLRVLVLAFDCESG